MFWIRRKRGVDTGSLGNVNDLLSEFRTNMGTLMNPPGLTIIRWILSVVYRSVAVDDTFNNMLLGLVVAPIDDAPPANALSNEFQRDWVLWDRRSWVQERQEGTPTHKLTQLKEYDIRSARKLDDPERTAYFIWEAQDSDTMDVVATQSLLVKLP